MNSPDEKQQTAFIASGHLEVALSQSLNTVKLEFASALTPGEVMRILLPAESVGPIRELLEQMEKEVAKQSPPPSGRH